MILLPLLCASPQTVEDLRLPASADASIGIHDSERTFNTGASPRLRLKGIEHVLLLDFDAAALRGRRVAEARLILRPAGPLKVKILGVSTVSVPWKEGDGNAEPRAGGVSFLDTGSGPWPAGDFLGSTFGRGGSEWRAVEAASEDGGAVSVPIPPEFVERMAAGRSHGLALSDEKGQTRWNNDFFSRETPEAGSVLLVRTGPGEPRPAAAAPAPETADPTRDVPFSLPRSRERRALGPLPLGAVARFTILPESVAIDPTREPSGSAPAPDWDGTALHIRAARGEHVGVVLALSWSGEPPLLGVAMRGPEGSEPKAFLALAVPGPEGSLADPLVPLGEDLRALPSAPGARLGIVHLEWFVPPTAPPGERQGSLLLESVETTIEVPVLLRVEDAALPDRPTFSLSLNTYAFPGGVAPKERSWFRLAHEHRATLAPVPYSQSGQVHQGAAPEIERGGDRVQVRSWSRWDNRFGPLFDGSAFEGLPRGGVPIDHFLLPLHENWPTPIGEAYAYRGTLESHWRDAPAIEEALPDSYARAFSDTAAAFARHLDERGWTETRFLGFLNDKVDFRARGAGTSWWLLDEPAFRDDFLALRWYARRFRDGVGAAKGRARMLFRVDLSRPQWRREHLDGLADLVVCNALRESGGIALETARRNGEVLWSYGEPPLDPAETRAWCLRAWLEGADGMVPWQSVGTPEAWKRPEATALLYPSGPGRPGGPFPSRRLKMLRRAAQDAEILNLLVARGLATREGIRATVGDRLDAETCERLRLAALDRLSR
ncbi:MAG: hypothetical protein L0323_04280 [Planctomycetes bacterium]|nr:hypothetical protein [Planctomycetota bacterium]